MRLVGLKPVDPAIANQMLASVASAHDLPVVLGPPQFDSPKGPKWRVLGQGTALTRISALEVGQADYIRGAADPIPLLVRIHRITGGAYEYHQRKPGLWVVIRVR